MENNNWWGDDSGNDKYVTTETFGDAPDVTQNRTCYSLQGAAMLLLIFRLLRPLSQTSPPLKHIFVRSRERKYLLRPRISHFAIRVRIFLALICLHYQIPFFSPGLRGSPPVFNGGAFDDKEDGAAFPGGSGTFTVCDHLSSGSSRGSFAACPPDRPRPSWPSAYRYPSSPALAAHHPTRAPVVCTASA